jgi:general secretion pathway protein I
MRRGFTLLEVLVATAVMAVAVTVALSALRTSLRNADRQFDMDRASWLARRKMEELLVERLTPRVQPLRGVFPVAYTGGVEAGWSAIVTPYELIVPEPQPGSPVLERVRLEIWWMSGSVRRTMQLEAYQRSRLTEIEAQWIQANPRELAGARQ